MGIFEIRTLSAAAPRGITVEILIENMSMILNKVIENMSMIWNKCSENIAVGTCLLRTQQLELVRHATEMLMLNTCIILNTWVEYVGVHSSRNIYRSRGRGFRVSRVELAPDGAATYYISLLYTLFIYSYYIRY